MPSPSSQLRWGRRLNNRLSGAWGEELALRYLTRQGYDLIERNYRTRYGEVDLILRQGTTIVFVEVKLRRGLAFGDPREAVTPRKQAAVRALAERYLHERRPPHFETLRFDVVGVLASGSTPKIVHLEDAF